ICGACPAGYTDTNGDGTQCDDINECTLGTDNCDSLTTCTNTTGGFNCSGCPSGYSDTNDDGTVCADINECTAGTDNCDSLTTCTNTAGGFSCSACPAGYTDTNGDGTQCADINECASAGAASCGVTNGGTCLNIGGSYVCTGCPDGYALAADSMSCTEIDECLLNVDACDERATCENTDGSYSCVCNAGTSGDGFSCTEIEVTGLPEGETPIQGPDVPVSGTGEPGTEITVMVDGTAGCTATVNASGNWQCDVQGLSDGNHTLTVEGPNDSGEEVAIVVDSTVSATITPPAGGSILSSSPSELTGQGEAGASVTVTVDNIEICTTQVDASGNWQCDIGLSMDSGDYVARVTITDMAGNVATDTVTWAVDKTTSGNIDKVAVHEDSPTTELDGTGEPGATVTVTLAGQKYTTTVDETGAWSVEIPTPSESGTYSVDVTITDDAGNTETISDTFEVEEKNTGAPPVDVTSIDEPSNTVSGGAGSCSVSGVPRGSGGSGVLLLLLLLLGGLAVRRKGAEK
ncbi:MAG: Ig-like domain repeat protein, partial [Deltaproteobacteria bacterium]|nr:Ig-like domain repeat protein [Deltaproteobacteria bacterium]